MGTNETMSQCREGRCFRSLLFNPCRSQAISAGYCQLGMVGVVRHPRPPFLAAPLTIVDAQSALLWTIWIVMDNIDALDAPFEGLAINCSSYAFR